jgi:predicted nucleic acid-binding protein
VKGWLIDTNLVSEARRARPHDGVIAFLQAQPSETLFVSEVTFAEIRYGIGQVDDPARRADMQAWLDHSARSLFHGRVLAITEDVIVRWKLMIVAGQKRGHTFSQPDLFLAAIAALEDLIVATRDTTPFVEANVPVFDPWSHALHTHGRVFPMQTPASLAEATAIIGKARRR